MGDPMNLFAERRRVGRSWGFRGSLVGVVAIVAACDTTVAFSIDASALAEQHPDAVLYADLVHYGELDEAVILDFQLGQTGIDFKTELQVGIDYGVVAYADLDRSGTCEPVPVDLPWLFFYSPGTGIDYVWIPDPAESPDAADACSWFGGGAVDEPPDPEPL